MHPNAELVTRFYEAFAKLDAEGMVACYHPEVVFSDAVFVDLRGFRAGAMWRMLCERAKGFELTFRDVRADDDTGAAHWDARYTFSATGRSVHNQIDAAFRFREGKIVDHRDTFDLWRWTRQALGVPGVLLGWAPFFQRTVRAKARAGLDDYVAKRGLEPGVGT